MGINYTKKCSKCYKMAHLVIICILPRAWQCDACGHKKGWAIDDVDEELKDARITT